MHVGQYQGLLTYHVDEIWNDQKVVKSRIFLTCEMQVKHADYQHYTVILHLTFLTSYDGRVFSEEKMDEKHQLLVDKSISPYLF